MCLPCSVSCTMNRRLGIYMYIIQVCSSIRLTLIFTIQEAENNCQCNGRSVLFCGRFTSWFSLQLLRYAFSGHENWKEHKQTLLHNDMTFEHICFLNLLEIGVNTLGQKVNFWDLGLYFHFGSSFVSSLPAVSPPLRCVILPFTIIWMN